MTQDFPRTPYDLLRIAMLPFVYLALGAWYLVAVPLAIAAWVVIAILLIPRRNHGALIRGRATGV
jgi:hypothetical protein